MARGRSLRVRTGIFRQERTVGANVGEVMDDFPTGMIEPEVAGRRILDGVARGRETIVFPFSARLFWVLAAWAPSLLRPVQRRLMRQFDPS